MTTVVPDRSDLAFAIAGLGAPAKRAIERAAEAGAGAVQLDAAAPGLRPRDLDRSARRDLAATLRRAELPLSGLDLWIPPDHFASPRHADRAHDAAASALVLATELAALAGGHALVAVTLPDDGSHAIRNALADAANHAGARLVDHTPRADQPAGDPADRPRAAPGIDIGIDPAVTLAAGRDPARDALTAGDRLASARLSDWNHAGRTAVGRGGRLDLAAFRAALSIASPGAPVVVDLRGVGDADQALERTTKAWRDAGAPG